MSWIIWIVIGTVLALINKRLLVVAAIVFGIGLALKWW